MKLIPACLLFIIQLILAGPIQAQRDSAVAAIPEKYVTQFKEDQRKYLERAFPLQDSSSKIFKLLSETRLGYRKNYNGDSLYSAFRTLRRFEILSKVYYIKQNLNSYASLYYLNVDLLVTAAAPYILPDSLLSIYSLFDDELKNTPLGKRVNEELVRMNALKIGRKLPDFTFKTFDGFELPLSSFQNQKYVLLIIWASWCKPCRENIPTLKDIQKIYKNKALQMISISIDDNPTKWLKSVEKYQMPWLQTCDLPLYVNGNSVRSLYHIKYVPQYFLIDKEGVLVYHNILSKDDDSHSQLKNILQNALN